MCTYINNKCFKSIAFDGASVAVAVAIVQAFTNLSLLLYPCRVKVFASPNVAVFLIFVVTTAVAAAAFVAILHDNIPTIQCYPYRNILRRSFFCFFTTPQHIAYFIIPHPHTLAHLCRRTYKTFTTNFSFSIFPFPIVLLMYPVCSRRFVMYTYRSETIIFCCCNTKAMSFHFFFFLLPCLSCRLDLHAENAFQMTPSHLIY